MAWYTAASSGATCVAAYDAIGAASLANSYVNEANPGTYDAAPGVAPTWAYGTGWTFNGSSQYLTTGPVPANDQTWSALIRCSGVATAGVTFIFGSSTVGQNGPYFLVAPKWVGGTLALYANGGLLFGAPAITAGVIGIAGTRGVINGALVAGTIGTQSGVLLAPFIGARNDQGSPALYQACSVQAFAMWSGTLDTTDVTTITAAMNALPTAAAALGLPVIAHHHRSVWR